MTKEQIEQIPALRNSGKSVSEIAKMFNVSNPTIRRWIVELRRVGHDVPVGKRGRKKIELSPRN